MLYVLLQPSSLMRSEPFSCQRCTDSSSGVWDFRVNSSVMEIESALPMAEEAVAERGRLPGGQSDSKHAAEDFRSGAKSESLEVSKFGDKTEDTENLRHVVRCLYWSHFLSRWGDRYAASFVGEPFILELDFPTVL